MSKYYAIVLLATICSTIAAQPIGPKAPKVVSFGVGDVHACAIIESGEVWCYGSNIFGQIGPTTSRSGNRFPIPDHFREKQTWVSKPFPGYSIVDLWKTDTAVDVGLGWSHTCILFKSGNVGCFGAGKVVGMGTDMTVFPNKDTPSEIPYVSLGSDLSVKEISVGFRHTCALMSVNRIKCFGEGGAGQLGIGASVYVGTDINDIGDNLPFVDFGIDMTVKKVRAGSSATMAILSNNKVHCFGSCVNFMTTPGNFTSPQDGLLDFGDHEVKDISFGRSFACFLFNNNNQVTCLGSNSDADIYGLLGRGDKIESVKIEDINTANIKYVDFGTGRSVKQIASGEYHTCAILDDNKVKCFGSNAQHYLGTRLSTLSLGGKSEDMGDNLPYVELGDGRTAKAIYAGPATKHTCVVLDNDQVKCFGSFARGPTLYLDGGFPSSNETSSVPDDHPMGNDLPYLYLVQPLEPTDGISTGGIIGIVIVGVLLSTGAFLLVKSNSQQKPATLLDADKKQDDAKLISDNPRFL